MDVFSSFEGRGFTVHEIIAQQNKEKFGLTGHSHSPVTPPPMITDSIGTTLPYLLYSGIDRLDIAFQGYLPSTVLDQLKTAKEGAQKTKGSFKIELGPGKVPVQVLKEGRRGGYCFQVRGPSGAIYAFKASQSANDWNIFVNAGSGMLLGGYYKAKEQIISDLSGFGITLGNESINRIDYCFDFLMRGFELNSDNFITPPRNKLDAYSSIQKNEDDSLFSSNNGRILETLVVSDIPCK